MKPEHKQQILPLGLLIAGLVTGGICWMVDGTTFWVLIALTTVFIIAGVVVAGRTEAAQRDRKRGD